MKVNLGSANTTTARLLSGRRKDTGTLAAFAKENPLVLAGVIKVSSVLGLIVLDSKLPNKHELLFKDGNSSHSCCSPAAAYAP